MFIHALYAGTVPWNTSTGSLFSATIRASPVLLAGEADPPMTGTFPFVSIAGSLARKNVDSSGSASSGYCQTVPCGTVHAGEEVK
ncbi:hypothetical protein Dtox_4252 [Desulfofarcimen acetoxidans DSM 771]|uniref:Uncharacterized protein n=1 Tax=Desulfofarcimen acetoxidans (strain ATCC 49208 / DSM 771 / KCTC 5769 / VKM B-1644 / 5575) TaxID=485916 RepID=C8VZH4_DESAS|nr:hypothetical protein [Desulfofarcimen acetoxidans]ACV64919.1 hypothetical protein Dtox_4252 [Desulfofarcimen acetoxidans DSM 771]